MNNKNIISYDTKGRLHGYCLHYINNQIDHRGTWKNNKPIGYVESHYYHTATIFHIR